MAVIEAYVTNLGKYNEGELASEPLKFLSLIHISEPTRPY